MAFIGEKEMTEKFLRFSQYGRTQEKYGKSLHNIGICNDDEMLLVIEITFSSSPRTKDYSPLCIE